MTRCVGACSGVNPAVAVFSYRASMGAVEAPLCGGCAKAWQKTFGHTNAGQTLSIKPAQENCEPAEEGARG